MTYFLIFELPFNVLLINREPMESYLSARDKQIELPWFSIWSSEQVDAWPWRKIWVPLKKGSHNE